MQLSNKQFFFVGGRGCYQVAKRDSLDDGGIFNVIETDSQDMRNRSDFYAIVTVLEVDLPQATFSGETTKKSMTYGTSEMSQICYKLPVARPAAGSEPKQ